MKLKVTTIRHDVSQAQLADFVSAYQTDPKAKARVDVNGLLKHGKSTSVVHDNGMKIETIVELTK